MNAMMRFILTFGLITVSLFAGCRENSVITFSGSPTLAPVPTQENTTSPTLSFPPADGFVNDFADVITDEQQKELESLLDELQDREKVEIVVAVVNDTGGQNIFDYSLAMAREWKVGSENGGALIVIAIKDRKWHLQISKKTEEYLTNDDVKKIGDVMVSDFKDQKYTAGIRKCVDKLIRELVKKQGIKLAM